MLLAGSPASTSRRAQVLLGERRVPYDYLIVATGARHAYFGHDDWEQFAPGPQEDRGRHRHPPPHPAAFEHAETADDADERAALLTFVVVGGGPTGVEMAGAIAELARRALADDFRNIDPRQARVILVEAGPRLLPAFPDRLVGGRAAALEKLGVEVHLGARSSSATPTASLSASERLATPHHRLGRRRAASPAATWLGAEKDRAGRVVQPT